MHVFSYIARKNGLGLTELVVGVALSSALAVAAGRIYQPIARSAVQFSAREKLDTSMAEMGQFIKAVGRLAQDCKKESGALVCTLAPMTPHNGTNQAKRVRFINAADGLEYQEENTPDDWTRALIAEGVNNFTVCDANDMRNHLCTDITPSGLSDAYSTLNPTETFVRFRLRATSGPTHLFYQSSFSIRKTGAFSFTWN